MQDLFKDKQWCVQRDSKLIPPQYRPNALTIAVCSSLSGDEKPLNNSNAHQKVWTVYSKSTLHQHLRILIGLRLVPDSRRHTGNGLFRNKRDARFWRHSNL